MSRQVGYAYSGAGLFRSKRPETIRLAVDNVGRRRDEFDVIAFRGMSGAYIAPAVADALDKELLCIRKTSEQSHGSPVEGTTSDTRYIIIDDFVSTGETVAQIVEAIRANGAAHVLLPLFVYTYRDHEFVPESRWMKKLCGTLPTPGNVLEFKGVRSTLEIPPRSPSINNTGYISYT
jgi:hypothetical protein